MKTTKEMIEVMQAFVDGKTIQIQVVNQVTNQTEWDDLCINPVWNWFQCDYRVKPEEGEENETEGNAVFNADGILNHDRNNASGCASGSGDKRMEKKISLSAKVEEKEDFTLRTGNPYVIAVDFDDCLFTNAWPKIGDPIWPNIRKLKERQKEKNAEIILWTCREGQELKEAIKACEKYKIELAAVNANLPCYAEGFGGDSRKIYAHEYWDDKSVSISPRNKIYADAISIFGSSQILKAIEELSELSQALCRIYLGDRSDYRNAAEEIVDVKIMLNQLEYLFINRPDFRDALSFYDEYKHDRLAFIVNQRLKCSESK